MSDAGNVNFRALQLFIAVYDSQSFSTVARREGVSPSMVSRTIHQLEDALGQQLFYRNTRAVVPTEAGRLFAAHARGISEQFSAARRDLQDRSLEPGGLVRINAPVYFGQRHIAPWLPGLTARYPQMQIELALTDDFIDPHRDATDVIFRIGSQGTGYAASLSGRRSGVSATPRHPGDAGRSSPAQHAGLQRLKRAQPLAVPPCARGMGALSANAAAHFK